mgnify:CR=1 FL=1
MIAKNYGKIINVTSVAGMVGTVGQINYSAAKGGVISMTKSMARELARNNICANVISLGIVATDMTAGVKEKYDRMIAAGLVPQGRWGQPEDVGRAVAALVRGDFGYSTGAVIEISGGMDIRRL